MKRRGDFHFKQFTISHDQSSHKVGTDGVLLGAWVDISDAHRILDIGTGSGVIAIMLAQRTGAEAKIDAVELQEHDAVQAGLNVKKCPWSEKITVIHSAIQGFQPSHLYDLIVSNPPFFINSWLPPDESRSKARHAGDLSFPTLLQSAARLLSFEGKFAVVLPFTEANQFIELAKEFGLHLHRRMSFRSRQDKPVERLLIEFSRKPVDVKTEELVLYATDEEWTEEYRALTRDFYLKA
ncbi:MAG TPA: methyltransferase [Chryseosolibacter sp.]